MLGDIFKTLLDLAWALKWFVLTILFLKSLKYVFGRKADFDGR